jgi:hypothetical protein
MSQYHNADRACNSIFYYIVRFLRVEVAASLRGKNSLKFVAKKDWQSDKPEQIYSRFSEV